VSTITIVTLIPNARDRLERCLESAKWADDLFCIVDPKTNDGSDEVARRYSKHVVTHEYVNKAAQCNWALDQIETEWTLILDADEWLSDELIARIKEVVGDTSGPNGYRILRRSYFFGKLIEHCGWEQDYNVRLFRTKKGRYQERRVHASIDVEGALGTIEEPMFHETYRSFEEYFTTFQRFTSWSAQDLFEQGRRARLSDVTLRPIGRFIKMYILRGGFRDGMHGAVLCGLAAFSVFTKYAKLWNLEKKQL
jgi:(heptosyl)LPS beta-1,4-glucosyltransferase